MAARQLCLAVTPGDPEGIGPEIVWKALRSGQLRGAHVLCVGAREPFDHLGAPVIEAGLNLFNSASMHPPFKSRSQPFVWLLPAPKKAPRSRHLGGFQSGWSIKSAVRLIQGGVVQGLVTGPISKEHLRAGGFRYPGHTEMLAQLCGTRDVTMMLANDLLRVALVTTHVSVRGISRQLTRQKIRVAVDQTVESMRSGWGIARPRIAVLGLNPHAGEAGIFGREEIETIAPEIRALQKKWGKKAVLSGPHPADTLFAQAIARPRNERFDAVICMYHDQGLIPVKLLDFAHTVNVTLGLPILRTSVDHGTGFDIAGKGIADPSSLISAFRLAVRLARNSVHQRGAHQP